MCTARSTPKVAVIIPIYRDADFLEDALRSVLAQTRIPDEIVVVNDCSPESFRIEQIVELFPAVIYKRNPTNLGLAASRNVGALLTDCEILSFLDADDQLHPQGIEFRLAIWNGKNAVTCCTRRFTGQSDLPSVRQFFPHSRVARTVRRPREIIFRNILTGAGLLISKELFWKMGGYDERLRSCEDFDLWLRLLEKGTMVSVSMLPLYFYRINPLGLSRNQMAISFWETEVIQRHFARTNSEEARPFWQFLVSIWWWMKHLNRYRNSSSISFLNQMESEAETLITAPALRALLVRCLRLHSTSSVQAN